MSYVMFDYDEIVGYSFLKIIQIIRKLFDYPKALRNIRVTFRYHMTRNKYWYITFRASVHIPEKPNSYAASTSMSDQ